jgi:hypothetical protein
MAQRPKKKVIDKAHDDVALVYSRSEDGKAYGIVRKRKQEIQLGTLRHLEEGKPIHGELVRLRPRDDSPVLFDVETDPDGAALNGAGVNKPTHGPAQVATEQYRQGWDSIWSRRSGSSALN